MKYVIVLLDGASDYPQAQTGKTPFECANKPCLDYLSEHGTQFLVKTVADDLKPGSDVANLSVLGYDPHLCYTGRSPLEAASMGVRLQDNQTSFRLNLVTLSDHVPYQDKSMVDYSAGEISTQQSHILISALKERFDSDNLKIYPGVSYRHLLVVDDMTSELRLTAPHDISGKSITDYLPENRCLAELMRDSGQILASHPINLERMAKGENPANSCWIWGEGKRPGLEKFRSKFGLRGGVVSAVDLLKGIAVLAGLDCPQVEGATGNIHTNFDGKAAAVIQLLKNGCDLVYAHIEAPDECGHRGELQNKIKSIELIDQKIVKVVKKYLDECGEPYKIMALPDHPTPISTMTHARDPVPCVIYSSENTTQGGLPFSERNAATMLFDPGYRLMEYFIGNCGKGDSNEFFKKI